MSPHSGSDEQQLNTVLEQYKSYVQDLGNNGIRYVSMQTLYLSFLGAIIAVLELASKQGASIHLNVFTAWVLVVFGWGVCALWWATNDFYRRLFGVIYEVLTGLEDRLPVKPYQIQTSKMKDQGKYLTPIQRFVPLIFAILIMGLEQGRNQTLLQDLL